MQANKIRSINNALRMIRGSLYVTDRVAEPPRAIVGIVMNDTSVILQCSGVFGMSYNISISNIETLREKLIRFQELFGGNNSQRGEFSARPDIEVFDALKLLYYAAIAFQGLTRGPTSTRRRDPDVEAVYKRLCTVCYGSFDVHDPNDEAAIPLSKRARLAGHAGHAGRVSPAFSSAPSVTSMTSDSWQSSSPSTTSCQSNQTMVTIEEIHSSSYYYKRRGRHHTP